MSAVTMPKQNGHDMNAEDIHQNFAVQAESSVRPASPKRASHRLRWRKNPAETGLRAVGAGPRGSKLHDGTKEYASVSPRRSRLDLRVNGWYWVCAADVGGEYVNTYNNPAPDEDTAKAQAMAYVKAALAKMA